MVDEIEEIRKKKMKKMMEERSYPDTPIVVKDADFGEIIRKYPFVIIDCWAEWCAPCHMIAPVIEELAKDYAGKIVFGRLDVDGNSNAARQYGIMSIPTLLLFKQGKLIDQIVGAMPREILEPRIKKWM